MLLLTAIAGIVLGLILIMILFYRTRKRSKPSEEITNLRFPRATGKSLK